MVHAKGHSRETFLHLYEAWGTLRDIVYTECDKDFVSDVMLIANMLTQTWRWS